MTSVPTIPWLTLSENVELTVNVAEGEYEPWTMVTVFVPSGDGGTWELQTRPPDEFVFAVQSAIAPFQLTVVEVDPANPVPVTVIAVPTGPEVGVTAVAGVTVKGASAEFELSAAVTVWAPAVASGTGNEQANDPTLFVDPEQTTGLASQVTV